MDIGALTGSIELEDQLSDVLEIITKKIESFAEEFGHAFEEVAIGAGAVVLAITGVTAAVTALGDKGSTILGVEDAFNRLSVSIGTTGDELLGSLREGVKGTIDDFGLMQAESRLLSAGVKLTADDMGTMGAAARAMGKATGTDAADGLDKLNSALLTGRTRGLAQAGILVDTKKATEDFAASIGVEVSQLSAAGVLEGKRIAILQSTKEYVDRLGVSELSFKEIIQQSVVGVEEWVDTLAKSVASSSDVNTALKTVTKALQDAFGDSSKTLLDGIVTGINAFAKGITVATPYVVSFFGGIAEGVKTLYDYRAVIEVIIVGFIAYEAAIATVALANVGMTAGLWLSETAVLAYNTVVGIAEGETISLGVAMAGAVGPIGLVAIAIGSVFAAYKVGQTQEVSDFFEKIGLRLQGFSSSAADAVIANEKMMTSTLAASASLTPLEKALQNTGAVLGDTMAQVNMNSLAVDNSAFINDKATESQKKYAAALLQYNSGIGTDYLTVVTAVGNGMYEGVVADSKRVKSTSDLALIYGTTVTVIENIIKAEANWQKSSENAAKLKEKQSQDYITAMHSIEAGEQHLLDTREKGLVDLFNMTQQYSQLTNDLNNVGVDKAIAGYNRQRDAALATAQADAAQFGNSTDQLKKATDAVNAYFDQMVWQAKIAGPSIEEVFQKAAEGADRVPAHIDTISGAITNMASVLTSFGQTTGGVFGSVISGLGQLENAWGNMIKLQAAANAPGASAQTIAAAKGATPTNVALQGLGMGFGLASQAIDTSGSASKGAVVAAGALQGASVGMSIGLAAGAAAGAAAGSAVPIWGTVIGAGVGAVVGLVQAGKEWRQNINDIARDFGGIRVSDDFAKSIADLEDSAHLGSVQAMTTQLDQLITLSGGLNDKNLSMFIQKLHDGFSYVADGTLSVAQQTQILDKNWQAFVTAGTDADGRLSDSLKEIISLNQTFETQSKAIADYLKQQGVNAEAGFTQVVAGTADAVAGYDAIKKAVDDAKAAQESLVDSAKTSTIDSAQAALTLHDAIQAQGDAAERSKQELDDLGVQAVATFAAAVASGTPVDTALANIHGSLVTLQQSYTDLGLNVDDVALKNIMMQDNILNQNPALITAISGLTSEMITLDNMGLMNADTFGAMERTGETMYTRLQSAAAATGGTTKDALLPMQDYLHQATIEAGLLGIPLDSNTQELIRQSQQLGIWKDAGKSATDILTDSMTKLVDKVAELIDQLKGIPPHITTTIDVTAGTTGGSGKDENAGVVPEAGGTDGMKRITSPTMFYSKGNEDVYFSGEGKSAPSGGGGGNQTIQLVLQDGRVLAEVLVPYIPGELQRLGLVQ